MTEKTCALCNRFFVDKTRPKNRLFCSYQCQAKMKALRHQENKQKDPEYRRIDVEKGLKKRLKHYGITPEQYNEMLVSQKGVCKTCRKPCRVHPRLSVDHDHKTGKVRGLLCHHCNNIVKLFDNTPEIMGQIVEYVRSPQ